MKRLLVALVLCGGLWGGAAEAGERFVAGLEALPLMPGLIEDAGERLVFDSAEGRLVEALARGRVGAVAVRRFYEATLPELGWRRRGDLLYEREGERLALTIAEGEGTVTVRFALGPAAR